MIKYNLGIIIKGYSYSLMAIELGKTHMLMNNRGFYYKNIEINYEKK